MKLVNLTYLIWLVPVALLFLFVQQGFVYYGITSTYENGEEHTANITDFRIKQIAAQTNGYVDLQFTDDQGENVQERLSLHAQHASRLIGSNTVEVRYLPGASYDIVITKTYDYHRKTVLINLAVILFSFIVMTGVSIFATRYTVRKKARLKKDENSEELKLEFTNVQTE